MKVLILEDGPIGHALWNRCNWLNWDVTRNELPREHFDVVLYAMDPPTGVMRMAWDAEFFSWVKENKPAKTVYFSGAEAYPRDLQLEPHRLRELDIDPMNPRSPGTGDGWAKLQGEVLADSCLAIIFRPFEVYGLGLPGVFQQLVRKINDREDPFIMHDSGRVLDFVHIGDVVNVVIRAIDTDRRPPSVVNICTGQATHLDDLATMMFEKAGWQPKDFLAGWEEEALFTVGDPTRMNTLWIPRVPLERGILQQLP